ncbi:GntR family transcriptional regulator [Microbacterium sp. H1-D42]|uniref:GntR family transcriptional regulator n=1 Tax=Microbacterium sp. H1-D42 TaxID=2925844 RepID=UPI001F53A298|nr:GntR family transcriptional regulator [Microbacterium sp. H1-D42]UNK70447.1 GntR family transcriptional regulator [Microbacterium sp. H1-D42]
MSNAPTEASVPRTAFTSPLQPLTAPRARYRISDAVFTSLSESIRRLQLPPGSPISEPGIAASLQVSRSPVREAITRLVDLGLVTVVPQVGSQIAPISIREVEEAVFIRRALETSAFKYAIADGVPDVTEIQAHVDANAAAAKAGDLETFFDTDELLHQTVFALAGVPRLWDVVRGTKMQLDRLRRLNLQAALTNGELLVEHQQLVDALVARDLDAGTRVIDKHSTRVLTDTVRLRAANPTFFAE